MPELRHSAPQRKRQTTASSRRAGAAARPSCVRAWQVKDENAHALRARREREGAMHETGEIEDCYWLRQQDRGRCL